MPHSLSARVISVNVGKPRRIETQDRVVITSFFKTPVEGRVALRGFNLEGDRQADPRVHGGPYKAVYLYPFEHYEYWSAELREPNLPYGSFGENLTTTGVTEETVHIGDRIRIGSAVLQVTQPRMPCAKLALRFGRHDMVRRFWQSGRSGVYFSVVQEGEMAAGDPIDDLAADPEQVSVADVVRLFKGQTQDDHLFARALRAPLYGSWKQDIRARWEEREGVF